MGVEIYDEVICALKQDFIEVFQLDSNRRDQKHAFKLFYLFHFPFRSHKIKNNDSRIYLKYVLLH